MEVTSTPRSRVNEFFRAANGHTIYNEGQTMVTMTTREGTRRDMRFIACDLSTVLGSRSQMCRIGHRVVLNPPWDNIGSYVEHIDAGEKMWLEEN